MGKDVLTIPAAETIELIYQYGVHAQPYLLSYNRAPFIAFRKRGGVIEALFRIQQELVLDLQNDSYHHEISYAAADVQQRLYGYIQARRRSRTGFEKNDSAYSFWLLEEYQQLAHAPRVLPNNAGHIYTAYEEVMSGRPFVFGSAR